MFSFTKTLAKVLTRKKRNNKYYEAADVLTKQEQQDLYLALAIIAIPLSIGIVMYFMG